MVEIAFFLGRFEVRLALALVHRPAVAHATVGVEVFDNPLENRFVHGFENNLSDKIKVTTIFNNPLAANPPAF